TAQEREVIGAEVDDPLVRVQLAVDVELPQARGEQGQDHDGAQHRQQQDPPAPPRAGRVEEDLGGGSAHGRISSRSFLCESWRWLVWDRLAGWCRPFRALA